ncbi:MAG: hypothetical protein AAFV80_05335 [Bacteroidota bacterium]
MSRSYHITVKALAKKSKRELDEMVHDPDSELHQLAQKTAIKRAVKKERKRKSKSDELY